MPRVTGQRQQPHLRRNQACHQCRKRKLKCDAQRPCSCCIRSHAGVIAALAIKGEPFSPVPTCTYDEHAKGDSHPYNATKQNTRNDSFLAPSDAQESLHVHNMAPVRAGSTSTSPSSPESSKTSGNLEAPSPLLPPPHQITAYSLAPPFSSRNYDGTHLSNSLHDPQFRPGSSFAPPTPPASILRQPSQTPFALTASSSTHSRPLHNGHSHTHAISHNGLPQPPARGSNDLDILMNRDSPYPSTDPLAHSSTPESAARSSQNQILPPPAYSTSHPSFSHGDTVRNPVPLESSLHKTRTSTTTQIPRIRPPTDWPIDLPPAPIVYTLAEIFFSAYALAPRLLHRVSFLDSIRAYAPYQPKDPRFPSIALLHAICAMGSLFIDSGSSREATQAMDVCVRMGREFQMQQALESGATTNTNMTPLAAFADRQVECSRKLAESDVRRTRRMLESVQSTVILSWYAYMNARWVDSWAVAGLAIRQLLTIGINHYEKLEAPLLIDSWRDKAIIPNADTVADALDHEMRMATFWLAFITDTHQLVSTSWPGAIDELDISQTFPCTLDDFESSSVCPEPRQNLHTQNVFTTHPYQITDGFTLHLKGSILIGRVAKFNTRLKNTTGFGLDERTGDSVRALDRFKKIEGNLEAFKDSLKGPWALEKCLASPEEDWSSANHRAAKIDANLYVAHIIYAAAIILLHDPHAEPTQPTCPSAAAILDAARFILETIEWLNQAHVDFSRLVHNTALYWAKAAAVFINFYGHAIEADDQKDAVLFRKDAETVKAALVRMGERLPVARALSRMVQDWMDAACNLANKADPDGAQVWSYLRYSERRKTGVHPAKIGDRHTD